MCPHCWSSQAGPVTYYLHDLWTIPTAVPGDVDTLTYKISLVIPPNKFSDTTITPDDSVPLYVELLNTISRSTYVH